MRLNASNRGMVGKDTSRQGVAGKTGEKITDHMVKKFSATEKDKLNNKKDLHSKSPPNTMKQNPRTAESSGLEEVMRMLRILTSDVQEIKRDYSGIKDVLDKSVAIGEECKAKMQQIEVENEMLKNRILMLEKKSEGREREEKRNNVIIRGLEVNEEEVQKTVEDLFADELNIREGIDEVKPYVKAGAVVFITVKLDKAETKKKLMINKKNLAGTAISINHDMTFEEREVQRKIINIAKERREQGATVKVGYRKLWIDDKLLTWREGAGLIEKFRQNSGAYTQPAQHTHDFQRQTTEQYHSQTQNYSASQPTSQLQRQQYQQQRSPIQTRDSGRRLRQEANKQFRG